MAAQSPLSIRTVVEDGVRGQARECQCAATGINGHLRTWAVQASDRRQDLILGPQSQQLQRPGLLASSPVCIVPLGGGGW